MEEIPRMFEPARAGGMEFIWIWVGFVIPIFRRFFINGWGRFRDSNVRDQGGERVDRVKVDVWGWERDEVEVGVGVVVFVVVEEDLGR